MFGLGVPEIIVIAIIILLIFGAKRLPIIGESLGKTVKEIRNAKKEISEINKSEIKKEVSESNESEGQSQENDIVDKVQKKVTKQVTDKLLGQVPGIKQAKQLKDKTDKIKKIIS
ncbi:MAG TPA: twin-arginine translocase TatA/TatE family subunit [Desulfobacterales bacterium]|nr:twin-arginine translocase TatA/TatE family subunit [Desulfobacterales bacterium]